MKYFGDSEKTIFSVRESRQKRLHISRYHLYEISKESKSIVSDMRLVVDWG